MMRRLYKKGGLDSPYGLLTDLGVTTIIEEGLRRWPSPVQPLAIGDPLHVVVLDAASGRTEIVDGTVVERFARKLTHPYRLEVRYCIGENWWFVDTRASGSDVAISPYQGREHFSRYKPVMHYGRHVLAFIDRPSAEKHLQERLAALLENAELGGYRTPGP